MFYHTYVRIHLEKIRKNLEAIRSRIGPGPKLLLSLKGNADGHGAVKIACMAENLGLADWFGVARVSEGIELRDAGIHLPILKFSPAFPEEMAMAVGNGITLAVCESANIQALQVISAAMNTKARVHLKVETGLGRIGVDVADAADLAGFIEKNCPNIHLEGVFSHLAVSEDDAGAAFTEAQIALFGKTVDKIVAALGRPLELVHCANSGAILKFPNGWFSMVRTGQAAFGSLEGVPDSMPLHPCMSFFTRISFLKKVKRGTKIGYGLTWEAHEDTWIGTMPVGWGDGLNRYFSNRGRVLLNGRSYPIVGTLSMDQSMIDLGADTDVRVGDEVVLVGRSGNLEITMMELAKALNTVPLEITSLIPPRVKRMYG